MTLGIGAMALYGAVTSGFNSVPSEHVMFEMRRDSIGGRSSDMERDSMSSSSSSSLSSSSSPSSPSLSAAYTAGGGGADYQQLQQAEMSGGDRMGMGDKVLGKAKTKANVYLPDRKPTDSKLERFIGRGG